MTDTNHSKRAGDVPALDVPAGSAIPRLTQCPLCLGWHSGAEDTACYRCAANPPKRHGAYWLHPDGWYRLFPPNANVQGSPAPDSIKQPD